MSKKKGSSSKPVGEGKSDVNIVPITGMYEEYFVDYASYVILERAIPKIEDGLKPVQRRILYGMREKEDGRYNKVANLIGHTMQYHPHGDAAIGAAMVKLGQKNLLIDTQGNWGDVRTGDSAAAARYIEARLTKFALDVAYNPQTTDWQISYDGRRKEPIALPMKFPLLLAQGVEGIAVGLSTKILPHNFCELIKASIKVLRGKPFKIYPDFETGGSIDVSEYNAGKRGGKVKIRAKMEVVDKNIINITELPYGVTSNTMIDSIIKANDKGKIKIKKVVDNTAKEVEIQIILGQGISPQVTMDALYAFTNCEISVSPNACVIVDNKPEFLKVNELLVHSTEHTKALLKEELEIRKSELEERWHMSSLEKIFIENRIYRDIEECESWEEVLKAIDKGLKQYVVTPGMKSKKGDKRLKLHRDITEEDITRLTEIKIKRISKYNKFKADERIAQIEEDLKQVKYDLKHLTDFAVAYFERLLNKYGKGRERKTVITEFETIKAVKVVANNAKLYVNYKEGFIGTSLKKDEFVGECSDIDDIIAFCKDGTFVVKKISDKVFMGKNILHTAVWKKGDDRTTYNMVYTDGKTGKSMAKRFNVTGVTREKVYDLTKGNKGSKVTYFTANANGESEVVSFQLTPGCGAHKKVFNYDFVDLAIKGRGSGGNIVTKFPVKKILQVEVGQSSLGAVKVWMDEISGRINDEERGFFLGEFDTGDQLIGLYKDGTYEVRDLEIGSKFDMSDAVEVRKFTGEEVISCLYYEGEKGWTMIKRFFVETNTIGTRFKFITEASGSKLYFATADEDIIVECSYKTGGKKTVKQFDLDTLIGAKGWKAVGNKIGEFKILSSKRIGAYQEGDNEANVDGATEGEQPESEKKTPTKKPPVKKAVEKKIATKKAVTKKKPAAKKKGTNKKKPGDDKLQAGDTIEFDF